MQDKSKNGYWKESDWKESDWNENDWKENISNLGVNIMAFFSLVYSKVVFYYEKTTLYAFGWF